MAEDTSYTTGIALIVEGATERVFYSEFIRSRALDHGAIVSRVADGDGTSLSIMRRDGSLALVKINNVGTASQMTNSADWFFRACIAKRRDIPWHVFLGYDTDSYADNITKFHQGDWKRLRDDIDEAAESVTDLAASADIEDIMLCDLEDVLVFLNLPADTPLPRGRPCLSADLKARSLVRSRGKCQFWGPKIYTSSHGNDVCPVGIFPLRGQVSFY